jgi:hypothetical protein
VAGGLNRSDQMCRDQCHETARQKVSYFFHLFRFWFWVEFSAPYLVGAKKVFVDSR